MSFLSESIMIYATVGHGTSTKGVDFAQIGPNSFQSTKDRTESQSCTIQERYQDCYWQRDEKLDRYTQVCTEKTRYVPGTQEVVYTTGTRYTSTTFRVLKDDKVVAEFEDSFDEPITDSYGSKGECEK